MQTHVRIFTEDNGKLVALNGIMKKCSQQQKRGDNEEKEVHLIKSVWVGQMKNTKGAYFLDKTINYLS